VKSCKTGESEREKWLSGIWLMNGKKFFHTKHSKCASLHGKWFGDHMHVPGPSRILTNFQVLLCAGDFSQRELDDDNDPSL
jgi:hypothetical protein